MTKIENWADFSSEPYFWTKAFISNPSLTEFYGPNDYEILESVEDFGVFVSKDSKRYTIWLKIGENRFMDRNIIWKTFDESLRSTDFSGINWKRNATPTPPINQDNGTFSNRSLHDFRKLQSSFFTYFMYVLDFENEALITSLLLEVWRNPFLCTSSHE